MTMTPVLSNGIQVAVEMIYVSGVGGEYINRCAAWKKFVKWVANLLILVIDTYVFASTQHMIKGSQHVNILSHLPWGTGLDETAK